MALARMSFFWVQTKRARIELTQRGGEQLILINCESEPFMASTNYRTELVAWDAGLQVADR